MSNLKRILMILPCAALLPAALAQDLSGTLTATGDYKAEIRRHTRKSGLPGRLQLHLPEGSLPVNVEALPVMPETFAETMRSTDAGISLPDTYRGYVSLTSGSYLNTSLSAGYRFVDTSHTTFGAWLQHNSSSLFRPDAETGPTAVPDVKPARKKLYDETLGLYGSHIFEGAGMLSASAAYHLNYFNYYSGQLNGDGKPFAAPTQTLNDFLFGARWQGVRNPSGFFVDGDLGYRYFGYRRFYGNVFNEEGRMPFSFSPARENDIRVGATAGYVIPDAGNISLALELNELLYSNKPSVNGPDGPIKSYGIATVTPAYTYTRGPWSLRAGVSVALSWDIVSAKDFATLHVAPDVALSYSQGKGTVYLTAKGGVKPNTLASRAELDMYQSPMLLNTLPQYSPVDATVGFRSGSFSGFSAGVHVSYAVAHNTPLTGWYPYLLFGPQDEMNPAFRLADMSTMSLKGFSLGAEAEYKLGTVLAVNGSFTYQRQSGENGYFNGPDRPRWTCGLGADVTPLEGLTVGAFYTYRGVRRLYLGESKTLSARDHNFTDGEADGKYVSFRLPDIYDLGFHAGYTLMDRYTFSAAIDNVLGCDNRLNPLIPTEGLSISGTISVLF